MTRGLASTILAIDLGKFKSVACIYAAQTGEHMFRPIPTMENIRGGECKGSGLILTERAGGDSVLAWPDHGGRLRAGWCFMCSIGG
jgi:hypothetical protein